MTERIHPITIVNFEKYHPANKMVNEDARKGGKLKWVRWEVRTHRDPDLLDLPRGERWIWPTLVGLAGEAQPRGVVRMSAVQLAREADIPVDEVAHALDHLRMRGRIKFTTRRVADDHPEGDEKVATYLRTNVPTYLPTDGSATAVPSVKDEQRAAVKEAKRIWTEERARHLKKSGPAYSRFTDPKAVNTLGVAVKRALAAGSTFAEIEDGIRHAAASPNANPYYADVWSREAAGRRDDQAQRERAMNAREREIGGGPRSMADILGGGA